LKDVNFTTYTYTLPAETSKAYQCFKWVITARKGGGNDVIQVSEFRPTFNDALVEVPFPDDDETDLKDLKDLRDLNDTIYNLSGQRLSRPAKGINIVQGKKIANGK
ncbi:MAG: hypothetical protein IKW91_06485, partial [Bacteroidaceae bacterium]|nr:hypothetical protein [Bacteroidaceae bacterium]